MPRIRRKLIRAVVVFTVAYVAWQMAGPGRALAQVDNRPSQEITRSLLEESVSGGMKYLTEKGMAADGSYHRQADPGVTALVTTALLRHGIKPNDRRVAKSLEYLESFIREDGGIHREGTFYRNYETSICVLCFAAANADGRYDELLKKANAFVKTLQWDEDEGKRSADLEFGGAGYGKHKRPDLSNTQFMIEALLASGDDANSEAIQRALAFVSRCQNLPSKYNETEFAKKNPDGGFYYTPASGGVSQAGQHKPEGGEGSDGGLRSYGSMTYAGLKSMIYAGVDREDQRVQAAVAWIGKHYDLTSNPGMGSAGLYYYFHTFAKALEALGQPMITDDDGQQHDWRSELVHELARRQHADGSWQNENERWMENDANLVTAYALLALWHAREK
jgi:squalene-hopene/tetraprenyl-beta-curcumene cyclase